LTNIIQIAKITADLTVVVSALMILAGITVAPGVKTEEFLPLSGDNRLILNCK
jgi:hypothetical protein